VQGLESSGPQALYWPASEDPSGFGWLPTSAQSVVWLNPLLAPESLAKVLSKDAPTPDHLPIQQDELDAMVTDFSNKNKKSK